MYYPTYKDWPKRHVKLLQLSLSLLSLAIIVLWFGVYPRWRRLNTMRQEVASARSEFKKNNVRPDSAMLGQHINDCVRTLAGSEDFLGLTEMANQALQRATKTFTEEIGQTYPAEKDGEERSSLELFVSNSSRIDYKDLYDRVTSEFKTYGVTINQQSLLPDEESNEPVYYQILKLLTIRRLVRLAKQHHLNIETNAEKISCIHALKNISYIIDEKEKLYLLEMPVSIRLVGGMADFLSFSEELLKGDTFLPIKNIEVYSEPPADFPAASSREVNMLHFKIICSLFFSEPNVKDKVPSPLDSNK